MEFLIILAICFFLLGPVAFILSLVALSKISRLREDMLSMDKHHTPARHARPEAQFDPLPQSEQPIEAAPAQSKAQSPPAVLSTAASAETEPREPADSPQPVPGPPVIKRSASPRPATPSTAAPRESLEQRLGTWVALICGIVIIFIGVGFFLKYAYEHWSLGPWSKVGMAAAGGILSIIVGEFSRRRGFETPAKGLIALGLGILYATLFAANRYFGILGTEFAFAGAVAVTVMTMLFAVRLDEALIAMLGLLGGYITPLILSTGENLPHHLFGYVLLLNLTGMGLAFFRQWKGIHILAFVGTFGLYAAWFFTYACDGDGLIDGTQTAVIAVSWLSGFSLYFLAFSMIRPLVHRNKTHITDAVVIAVNTGVTVLFLFLCLYADFRTALGILLLIWSAIHLGLFALLRSVKFQDERIEPLLLAAGLLYFIIWVPMFFEMKTLTVLWAVQGLLLVFAGMKYRNLPARWFGFAAYLLSVGNLLLAMDWRPEEFTPILNADFMTWLAVALAGYVLHLFYRLEKEVENPSFDFMRHLTLIGSLLLIQSLLLFEWFTWCGQVYAGDIQNSRLLLGWIAVISLMAILYILPKVSLTAPPQIFFTAACLLIGFVFSAMLYLEEYRRPALPVFNLQFTAALVNILCVWACGCIAFRFAVPQNIRRQTGTFFGFAGVILLWMVLTCEFFLFFRKDPGMDFDLQGNLSLSFVWAAYGLTLIIIGFWKKISGLRYLALGLFALLIAKVFLYDMQAVKSRYRIIAFLITGLALVGISFLYQFMKKKGAFSMAGMLSSGPQKSENENEESPGQ